MIPGSPTLRGRFYLRGLVRSLPGAYSVSLGWSVPSGGVHRVPRQSFETLKSRLLRDGIQLRSGLVDLLECVRGRGGVGQLFASAR
jgi:hypothetical protein